MVTADTLAVQGQQLRQIQSTTPLLQIIAKILGNVGSQNGGNAPSITRDAWLAATADLQGVPESDLLAFITDQLARIFFQGGEIGLSVTGDEVKLVADQVIVEGVNSSVSGSNALYIATPMVVANVAGLGPLRCDDPSTGECEYGPIGENYILSSYQALAGTRNVANGDLGVTLLYTGTGNITLTIPSGLQTGMKFRVIQGSTGKVTIAGSGVTVNGKNGHLSTGGQWHVIDVVQAGATQFVVYGDTAA